MADFTAQQMRDLVAKGQALGPADDPSFPIPDKRHLAKAILRSAGQETRREPSGSSSNAPANSTPSTCSPNPGGIS